MVISGSKSRQRLAALTQIVREVDSAPGLETALRVLVRRTREVMGSDVCTVYFSSAGTSSPRQTVSRPALSETSNSDSARGS